MTFNFKYILLTLLFCCFTVSAWSVPTNIIVRAKSKDAKFIGTSMGGANVTITHAQTGKILASGKTKGGTGNTDLIMRKPHERYKSIVDEGTAKFETTLDIDEPVLLNIKVAADLNPSGEKIVSSTQTMVFPGKDITGDGIIVEIPGLHVAVLNEKSITLSQTNESVGIKAEVRMMCGCPISPGGLWDAKYFEVIAKIHKNGKLVNQLPLKISEEASIFKTKWHPEGKGTYEVTVEALQTNLYNAGHHRQSLQVK